MKCFTALREILLPPSMGSPTECHLALIRFSERMSGD